MGKLFFVVSNSNLRCMQSRVQAYTAALSECASQTGWLDAHLVLYCVDCWTRFCSRGVWTCNN